MRKIVSFLTIQLFLISPLGADFVLAQGDFSSFRTPQSAIHNSQSTLRPRPVRNEISNGARAGQGTAEIQSALDGGARHNREDYWATFRRLKKETGRTPDAAAMTKALGNQKIRWTRHQSEKHGIALAWTPFWQYKNFGLYRDRFTDQIPTRQIVTLRRRGNGNLWLSFAGVPVEGLPDSLGKPGDKVTIDFERTGEAESRDLIASFRPEGISATEPAYDTRYLTIRDGRVTVQKKREALQSSYYELGRYRDRLRGKVPPPHVAQLRKGHGGNEVTISQMTLEGLPKSLGSPGDKVEAYFKRGGNGRNLTVFLRPYFASEIEPPHYSRYLMMQNGGIRIKRQPGADRLHGIRRLAMMGVDYEKLPSFVKRYGPSHVAERIYLFRQFGRPIRLGWFMHSAKEIRRWLEEERRAGKKYKWHEEPWAMAIPVPPRLLTEEESEGGIGKMIRQREAAQVREIGRYLAARKGLFVPYQQILKELPLILVRSENSLKRALGILTHQGFIHAYQKDGVQVIDPWFPPIARHTADGGARHSDAEYHTAYDRLKQALGRNPDSKELAKALGVSQIQARRKSNELGITLSPIYPLAAPLTRYQLGLLQEIPPDQMVVLRRASRGSLRVDLEPISIESLPESLGQVGDEVLAHFEAAGKKTQDLLVYFKPKEAPPDEPPHAMRRLLMTDKGIKIEKRWGADRLHDIRRLRAMGIDYESLSESVRTNGPAQLLNKLALFQQAGEPVYWSWIPYSTDTIRRRLEAIRIRKERKSSLLADRPDLQPIPDSVWKRIRSADELLARIDLFERHGVRFSPLYWDRATDQQKQKALEEVPYLQLLHFMLELYGIEDPAQRNVVIEKGKHALLEGGVYSRLGMLRRVITPHLGEKISRLRDVQPLVIILTEHSYREREALLVHFMNVRAENRESDPALKRQRMRLMTLYDDYLQDAKAPVILGSLKQLLRTVEDPKLRSSVQRFMTLLEEIHKGSQPLRGVRKKKEPEKGSNSTISGKKAQAINPKEVSPPTVRRLLTNGEEAALAEELGLKQWELRLDLELDMEGITQYLSEHVGMGVTYEEILQDAQVVRIQSVEFLKRALVLLSHQGFAFSYRNGEVFIIKTPAFLATRTQEALSARDGGARMPENIPTLFRMRGLVSGFASNVLANDPNFWRIRSVARYVVNRKQKQALPSDQDFEEFKKSLEGALGPQMRAILSDHKFSESEVDEMYTLLLELLEKALFMDSRYDYALSIAGRLPDAEVRRLALLNYEVDDPNRPAPQTVIASIQETEVAQAVTRVQEHIANARPSMSEEEKNVVLAFVLSIAGDRVRSHFGEKLTASDGGKRLLPGVSPQPFLRETRPEPALTSL